MVPAPSSAALVALLICLAFCDVSRAAFLSPLTKRQRQVTSGWTGKTAAAARNEVGDVNDPTEFSSQVSHQRHQEKIMEEMSLMGAKKIAAMSANERAKRAMLAEAIEDRIFDLTDELELLIPSQQGDNGRKSAVLPEGAKRVRAVGIAKEIKSLQGQYQELVSGNESSVLLSVESAFSSSDENDRSK